jgi:hypothetical protein
MDLVKKEVISKTSSYIDTGILHHVFFPKNIPLHVLLSKVVGGNQVTESEKSTFIIQQANFPTDNDYNYDGFKFAIEREQVEFDLVIICPVVRTFAFLIDINMDEELKRIRLGEIVSIGGINHNSQIFQRRTKSIEGQRFLMSVQAGFNPEHLGAYKIWEIKCKCALSVIPSWRQFDARLLKVPGHVYSRIDSDGITIGAKEYSTINYIYENREVICRDSGIELTALNMNEPVLGCDHQDYYVENGRKHCGICKKYR